MRLRYADLLKELGRLEEAPPPNMRPCWPPPNRARLSQTSGIMLNSAWDIIINKPENWETSLKFLLNVKESPYAKKRSAVMRGDLYRRLC